MKLGSCKFRLYSHDCSQQFLELFYDVEALLYIQETQLDKYRQELTSLNVTANVVQGLRNSEVTNHGASNVNDKKQLIVNSFF